MALTEAKPSISDELQKELTKSMEKGLIRVNYKKIMIKILIFSIDFVKIKQK